MKTERRQDLRTNELSTQLEDVGQYVKQNAVTLTIAVAVLAAITVGGFAFHHSQANRRAEAWNTIGNYDSTIEPAEMVAQAEAVVADDISPEITVAALLRIGGTSMMEYAMPTSDAGGADSASASSGVDWLEKAEAAYSRIVKDFAKHEIAAGCSMIALGVVAENRGDMEGATQWYHRVVENASLADTPLLNQAEYRLAGLDSWSSPIVFPPPLAGPEPDPAELAEKKATPPDVAQINKPPVAKKAFGGTPSPVSQKPKANTDMRPAGPKPVPTTMPADSE